ncbi:MAG: hypothetical protein F6J93_34405 [Oscillatoria sp. SIO1A7]|nr:hypothetical protein [Oscillatoria sp. SIO1A7]
MMRLGFKSKGRNSWWENIYRKLNSFWDQKATGRESGYSRLSQMHGVPYEKHGLPLIDPFRDYDLESEDFYARTNLSENNKNKLLNEIFSTAPEAWLTRTRLLSSWNASSDGSERGYIVVSEDEEVSQIANDFVLKVVGGDRLDSIVSDLIITGNAFAAPVFGIRNGFIEIIRLKRLQPSSIFRVEDPRSGRLVGFKQQLSNFEIVDIFSPLQCVHWRIFARGLYGKSVFDPATKFWKYYLPALNAIDEGARERAAPAWLHVFPEYCTPEYREAYKAQIKSARDQKLRITDYYLNEGESISLSEAPSDLKGNIEAWQVICDIFSKLSPLAPWELKRDLVGAQKISGAPGLRWAKFVNKVRSIISGGGGAGIEETGGGLNLLIKLQLALKGIPEERHQFEIVFPKIMATAVEADRNKDPQTVRDLEKQEKNSNDRLSHVNC